jgi:hypothetical protein
LQKGTGKQRVSRTCLPGGREAKIIGGMNKLAFLSTAFLVGLCACGGPSETAKPPATPTSDVGAQAPEPPAAEAAKSEPAKPEPAKRATSKTEAAPSAAALQANAPEKKGCTGLKKDVCKITLGCAWSTKGSCVDHE